MSRRLRRARPRREVGARARAPARAAAAAGTAAAPLAARSVALAVAAFAGLLAYAIVRYAVVKGEPLASLPLWTTNKAVAVFAVALVAAAAVVPRAPWRGFARSLGVGAGALHGVASLALLRPAYYPGLFDGGPGGRMDLGGEIAILCGGAALVLFVTLALRRERGARALRLARAAGVIGVTLVLAHCAALGLAGWLAPSRWPAGLPPMSLVGAVLALAALGARPARRVLSARSRQGEIAASPRVHAP